MTETSTTAHFPPLAPPSIEVRPHRSQVHGYDLVRRLRLAPRAELARGAAGPSDACRPRSAPCSSARTPSRRGRDGADRGAAAPARRRDARPHRGGRRRRAGAGRPVHYYVALPRGRPARTRLPPAARGRRRAASCSTATRWREGKPFFELGDAEPSPDHRLLAWSVDDKGRNSTPSRCATSATGVDLPDGVPRHRRRRRSGPPTGPPSST